MAVGARSLFSNVFQDLLFEVDFCPYPDTYNGDRAVMIKEANCLAAIGKKLADRPNCYAGIILEPLVQGAGGMRICRPEFLQKRSITDTVIPPIPSVVRRLSPRWNY